MAAFALFAKRILFASIPIPVIAILAVWAWVTWDKSSSIRKAVDAAVIKLVDGAELEAERAKVAGLQKIIDERDRQAEEDREALAKFADLLTAAENDKDTLENEIADLESRPINSDCRVDRDLLDRLRR